ncbi:MAG: restriction endonuclease [Phaeodactylibacter sp.]|nr:restriction endonuclease [Phaeodactylibacter sp.]MCB9050034.1 restriction endonuclease [Lewinellaceae bacterium]
MMEKGGHIQVFEHQYLRVGEEVQGVRFTPAHFEALARHADIGEGKYFTVLHQGIRFSSYVGVLQAGTLTIEILPKASRPGQQYYGIWQQALLEMLKDCRLLKVEHLSAASLSLRPNSILNLYIAIFLEETETLLRQGLAKTYSRQAGNLPVLKGRLLFQRHLKENLVQAAHFYTDHELYGYEHLFNRIIGSALEALRHFPLAPPLEARYRQLLRHFPELPRVDASQLEWEQLPFGRKTARYRNAVEAALLILRNYRPDIRSGRRPLIAILFDMNLLFEEYVFRQLAALQTGGLQVYRQLSRPFWERRYVRPDIVLEYNGQRFVLDTKWKVLKRASPNMEDLRQMFVYSHFFDARYGVLVYPQAYGVEDLGPVPFSQAPASPNKIDCQAVFVEIIREGRLNRTLGQDLLLKLNLSGP